MMNKKICRRVAGIALLILIMGVIAGCGNSQAEGGSGKSSAFTESVENENTAPSDEKVYSETADHSEDGEEAEADDMTDTTDSSIEETVASIEVEEASTEATEASADVNSIDETAEEEVYQIPEVISKLQKRSGGMFSDLYIDGDELFQIASESPVVDKGDYYEIANARFWFYDNSFTDWENFDDDFPLIDKGYSPVTVRVRKSASIKEYDDRNNLTEMSAEEYYSKHGKLGRDAYEATFLTGSEIVFDNEGYMVGFSDYME